MNHWLLRVGDGSNFINSSNKKIWGIQSKSNNSFLENIKKMIYYGLLQINQMEKF